MKNLKPPTTSDVISVNLIALHARLRSAEKSADAAIMAMSYKSQNGAVGHILDLERILPECDALYRTIILLHRSGDNGLSVGGAA